MPTTEIPGEFDEHPTALASRIASKFCLASPVEALDFPEKGNINRHTYLILGGAGRAAEEFLLQQINQAVFREPEKVMAAMLACIEAQRRSLALRPVEFADQWATIELISTRAGAPYLRCDSLRGPTYWRLMKKISGCRTFKSLGEIPDREARLATAREAGRGLALFGDLTAEMDISALENPLPGYRDTRLYYQQLHSVLAGNRTAESAGDRLPRGAALRKSTEWHFLQHLPEGEFERRRNLPGVDEALLLVLENEGFAATLLEAMDAGRIRRVAIHGDTKLDNFLFGEDSGRVTALIDLDTIMPHTWLADWGDMVRSLANVAGEKEPDPTRVQVDVAVFDAVARGFLQTAETILPGEVALMVDAVRIITLELGVRFLTDYLRGDTYFRLSRNDPPDLNRIRAIGQLTLFRRLSEQETSLRQVVERWCRC